MTRLVVAALCVLLGVACTPATEPGADGIPGCEGKCDGIGGFAPIAGPESLVHCELTSARDVVCDYTGVPDSFPVGVTVDVTALGQGYRDSSGRLQSGQLASTEFQEPGRVTLLGALPSDQLPVTLIVNLAMRADFLIGSQPSERSDLRSMSQTFRFEAAGDETTDVALPLEFWPVRVFAAEAGNVRNTDVGPQPVDIAPWDFFIGESAVEHSFNLPMIHSEPQELLLPVAPGLTSLNARGTYCASDFSCDEVNFVFHGPGIYALSGEGAETFEPPAGVDAGPGLDGSVDGGAGIDAGAFDGGVSVDAGSTDAGPPPCGTNGQRPCADGACAENHELDGEFCYACGVEGEARCTGESDCAAGHYLVSNICEACGDDGQVACRNSAGRYCNDGHYYSSSRNDCTACGDDGQIACRDISGHRYCNDGHYYSSSRNDCTVCGDDGQIACRDSSGHRYCNDGHYYSSSRNDCTVCGDDGQIACRDSSGNRYCNDGHYYSSSRNDCTVCGDGGQIACRNSSGSRYCNDGFRVSNGMCIAE